MAVFVCGVGLFLCVGMQYRALLCTIELFVCTTELYVCIMSPYRMAMISRLLKTWFSLAKEHYKRGLYFANETYDFKEPTNRCHPTAPLPIRSHKKKEVSLETV